MFPSASHVLYASGLFALQLPWASETSGNDLHFSGAEKENRRQDMKTIIIRLSERLLDLVKGCLKDTLTPSKQQAKAALASCLPALYDIHNNLRDSSSRSELTGTKEALYIEKLIKVGFVACCLL